MSIRKRLKAGFTLVELMIVVAIIGVLAVLAIYGVKKYLANSKTAEAKQNLGRLGKDAARHFEEESLTIQTVLGEGAATDAMRQLCGSAGAVPNGMGNVTGKKYQSTPPEWSAGSSTTGWRCLKFELQTPQYYMYSYTSADISNPNGANFTAEAQGDLDGNLTISSFILTGAAVSSRLKLAPQLTVSNEDE
jgi:type IV pilus assembly protein PilA